MIGLIIDMNNTKNNGDISRTVPNTEGDKNNDAYVTKQLEKITPDDMKPKSQSDLMCAPGLQFEGGSCMRLLTAIEYAKAYNYVSQPEQQIVLSTTAEMLNPLKYKAYLIREIGKRNADKCTTQKCWMEQDFVRYMNNKILEELVKHTYRPDSPQGKFEWLNTYNINDGMAQYENKYKDFKFFGAIPMDFADLNKLEINDINYDKLYKSGITKLGVIFNLDNHDQPGSHWVAMFSDLEKGNIFFFDSFGVKPDRRVRTLMRTQAKYLESTGKTIDNIRVDYNKVQHQKGSSECGVYSMNFLIRMAKGVNFDELCNNPVSDKRINKCRSVYFDKYAHKSN